MKTKWARIESQFQSRCGESEAETSTASVLLKESGILAAGLAGRKPALFGKANFLFLSVIAKVQLVRRRYVFYGWPFFSKLRQGICKFLCLVYLLHYITHGL